MICRQPGEPGVVVLRREALERADSDSDTEPDGAPPSPCRVRFVNDNVLINGRTSMPSRPNKDRISKVTHALPYTPYIVIWPSGCYASSKRGLCE